ncbi:geranyl transferase [Gilliamella sp. Choc4-2]|jgi:farnesyl diphosphate synthase|uniref:(2E,6E)-farnesyl diphosphate synthase n=1 Tax=unclassified Gilliamella TaxID=2685620 RepID=UPI0004DD362D|nr:(2E,6E)-farnesyl diphosphate synthase [Gilliamella apicola]KFA59636.1 Octaprenyl-diphosphate synthase / Dimethylallyltransferase / Geranyltranstransferase (farnesyldiphosphate synthase) / Geranylgeranyl pyrophosphate synthetase [Gilliamella apicola]OCG33406.1 geranyl transferase [Gilliamella apicola]OCG43558.1 geranyl transferase [Gilliamella apicola]OCG53561.1 geranyl transferase [Gilliamella apicola]OCG63716.1 geranyl transferase [Gilliamella apicola]
MNSLQPLQQRIDSFLTAYIAKLPSSKLQEAMSYSLLAGGKRIRPILVYLTGQMFNCPLAKLDEPSAAIEAIHTYSLIHDDLPAMDNDNLRRGKPTCHIQFGEAQAILAGDALQSLAFSLLAKSELIDTETKINMIAELAHASGVNGMCLGQSLDLAAERQLISIEHLQKIHCYKTGTLIKSAIRLGAFASGDIAKPYYKLLDNYAESIGLAFQIQDDILDIVGEPTIMGKSQGSDITHEKSTYPALIGLENAKKLMQQLYYQAIDSLNQIPYNSQTLHDLANFIIHRTN